MAGLIKQLKELMDAHGKLWDGDLQWRISDYVTNNATLFEHLDKGAQGEIVYEIKTRGITKVINEATKQTDIMEEIEKGSEMEISNGNDKSLQTSADFSSGVVGEIGRRERALILDARIKDAMTDIYIATAEIIDNKLYNELGHTTAKSYFETIAISERKAYQYAVIGREIQPHAYLPSGKMSAGAKKATDLGYSKLEEIVRHAKDQIDNLISNGEIQIGDETLSREDLENKSVRELRRQLKEAKQAKERSLQLEHELKHANRSVEDLKADVDELRKYKEKITSEKEVRENLNESASHVADAVRLLRNIKTNELDELMQEEFVRSVNTSFDLLERIMTDNAPLFNRFAE